MLHALLPCRRERGIGAAVPWRPAVIAVGADEKRLFVIWRRQVVLECLRHLRRGLWWRRERRRREGQVVALEKAIDRTPPERLPEDQIVPVALVGRGNDQFGRRARARERRKHPTREVRTEEAV